MAEDNRNICFVVMGFGSKTDFESGRTLNLDATYRSIIKPTVEEYDLRCIRADEIFESSIIDTSMYMMLLEADLVIADISTANANALYELGVRHALRPNSTIVIKERDGKFIFDLNHLRTLEYQHLGTDIGYGEVIEVRRRLGELIKASLRAKKPDSPVYAYLPDLERPQLSKKQLAKLVDETENRIDRFTDLLQAGQQASKESDHAKAAAVFAQADEMKPGEPYILQQLALATYKTGQPTRREALEAGLRIIERLDPEQSHDPETLGIAGAIHKRIWQTDGTRAHLDAALRLYGRGFELRRDYYTGENYALCCDLRAALQNDPDEAFYDHMTARKAREMLISALSEIEASGVLKQRSDRRWILATFANAYLALGNERMAGNYEAKFREAAETEWEIATYEDGKRALLEALAATIGPKRRPAPESAGNTKSAVKKATPSAGARERTSVAPTKIKYTTGLAAKAGRTAKAKSLEKPVKAAKEKTETKKKSGKVPSARNRHA